MSSQQAKANLHQMLSSQAVDSDLKLILGATNPHARSRSGLVCNGFIWTVISDNKTQKERQGTFETHNKYDQELFPMNNCLSVSDGPYLQFGECQYGRFSLLEF